MFQIGSVPKKYKEKTKFFLKKILILLLFFQWYLVCDRLPLLSTVQGSYMFGVFVGCIVFGWASDR